MNKFIVDYDQKTLELFYKGETFNLDLNEGDVGDFWHTLILMDGKLIDINFYQEDEHCEPSVGLYDVYENEEGKLMTGDSLDYIKRHETKGDYNNYFYPNTKGSGKVAKLVYISLATRVIVDANATEEEIVEASKENFLNKINTELHENLEEILDDEEMPFNKSYDG